MDSSLASHDGTLDLSFKIVAVWTEQSAQLEEFSIFFIIIV